MTDLTRGVIEDHDIQERMAQKKVKLEREARAKLSTKQWHGGIKKLMDWGVATAEDWDIVRSNVGSSTAMKTAIAMGFCVDEENNKDIRN